MMFEQQNRMIICEMDLIEQLSYSLSFKYYDMPRQHLGHYTYIQHVVLLLLSVWYQLVLSLWPYLN